MLKVVDFDEAIIGKGYRCGQPDILVYSKQKIIQMLIEKQGMTEDGAIDYYYFNIQEAWMGEQTPIFVDTEWEEGDEDVY